VADLFVPPLAHRLSASTHVPIAGAAGRHGRRNRHVAASAAVPGRPRGAAHRPGVHRRPGRDLGGRVIVDACGGSPTNWLTLDRTLTEAEHQELLLQIPVWCGVDRTMSNLTAAFGPPSVLLGPSSKLHPKTLVYAAADRTIICFHLWNGIIEPETGTVDEEPVLLAVRIGGQLFPQSLIFTPEGVRLRPEEG
jgi:hypothetical protein